MYMYVYRNVCNTCNFARTMSPGRWFVRSRVKRADGREVRASDGVGRVMVGRARSVSIGRRLFTIFRTEIDSSRPDVSVGFQTDVSARDRLGRQCNAVAIDSFDRTSGKFFERGSNSAGALSSRLECVTTAILY